MNLSDFILFHSRIGAPSLAIYSPGSAEGLISYGRLGQTVESIARTAAARSLKPGMLVAIAIANPILHAAAAFGLMRLGLATVSVDSAEEATSIGADAILSDSPVPQRNVPVILLDQGWLQNESGKPVQAYAWKQNEICRLARSELKAGQLVALSPRLLLDRAGQTLTAFGPRWAAASTLYSTLALPAALGFELLLASLMRGGAIVLPHGAHSPVQFFERYGVQAAISDAGQWTALLQSLGEDDSQQYGLEAGVSVGIAAADVTNAVRARISSNLVTAFHSAETGFVAAAPLPHIEGIPDAIGYPLPGIVLDGLDQAAPGGIARIKSDYCAKAYGKSPDDGAALGWAMPGLRRTTDGALLILAPQLPVENPPQA